MHHHRNTARDFHVFNRAAKFGFCFAQRLSVFDGDEPRQFVDVLFEQHLQLEERLDAVFRRRASPFREGGRGGFDGGIYFAGFCKRNFAQGSARGGIDDFLPVGRSRIGPLPADEMGHADVRNSGCAHGRNLCDREE